MVRYNSSLCFRKAQNHSPRTGETNRKFIFLFFCTYAFSNVAGEHEVRHVQTYACIKDFIGKYKRPITVLELGSQKEAYSFRIAQEFDATCVIMEHQITHQLLETCLREKYANILLLSAEPKFSYVRRLTECEHFDVVLILNGFYEMLKRLPEGKKEYVRRLPRTLLDLGDYRNG